MLKKSKNGWVTNNEGGLLWGYVVQTPLEAMVFHILRYILLIKIYKKTATIIFLHYLEFHWTTLSENEHLNICEKCTCPTENMKLKENKLTITKLTSMILR